MNSECIFLISGISPNYFDRSIVLVVVRLPNLVPVSCIKTPRLRFLSRFALVLQRQSNHDILDGRIEIRWRGYVELSYAQRFW
jgi:hypothetical protein